MAESIKPAHPTVQEKIDVSKMNWFSIIIMKLPKEINEYTILPTTYVLNEYGKKIMRPDRESYVNTYMTDDNELIHTPIYKWQTPKQDLNLIKDTSVKLLLNSLKFMLNSKSSAISWHNGDKDVNCQFHGYHLHIMQANTTNSPSITQTSCYMKLKSASLQNGCELKSQKIKMKSNFSRYLLKKPKVFKGCNNAQMLTHIVAKETFQPTMTNIQRHLPQQTPPNPETDLDRIFNATASWHSKNNPPPQPKRQIKKTVLATNTESLKKLMGKYEAIDQYTIFAKAKEQSNHEDMQEIMMLYRQRDWQRLYKQAISERNMEMKYDKRTYGEIYLNFKFVPYETTEYLSVDETRDLFIRWTVEQSIDPHMFLIQLYAILFQKLKKINSFTLEGNSNAGKTYWINSVIPHPEYTGSAVNSKEFPFNACTDKPIILINELTISTEEQAEVFKNVLGGEPTYVNVKNQPPHLLDRKPVMITCNLPIWRFVTNQIRPFKNRMFYFRGLKRSSVLTDMTKKKKPNPYYFQQVFETIKLAENKTNIPIDETTVEDIHHVFRGVFDISHISDFKIPDETPYLPTESMRSYKSDCSIQDFTPDSDCILVESTKEDLSASMDSTDKLLQEMELPSLTLEEPMDLSQPLQLELTQPLDQSTPRRSYHPLTEDISSPSYGESNGSIHVSDLATSDESLLLSSPKPKKQKLMPRRLFRRRIPLRLPIKKRPLPIQYIEIEDTDDETSF